MMLCRVTFISKLFRVYYPMQAGISRFWCSELAQTIKNCPNAWNNTF